MEYSFDTASPVDLYLELDRGRVAITAGSAGQSSIRVEGDQPERLQVTREGDHLRAVVERRSLFDFAPSLQVWVTVPAESRLVVKTGSADVAISGLLAEAVVATGSGAVEVADVSGLTRVQTGSGDVRVGTAGELRVKTGSGDVEVGEAAGSAGVQTGSGDVVVGRARGRATLRTASGGIKVDVAEADLVLGSASGAIDVGRMSRGEVNASSASGSLTIGVPPGVPVWTDISTLTGSLTSSLAGAGRPEPGQDHLRLRAKTVSGDVRLVQLAGPDLR